MGPSGAERPGTPPVGVLVVDKPEGVTSHDVVARVRRLLGLRRVGHAGTLDPMATGVLVVGIGPGTRLLPWLQATVKVYDARVRLGRSTTTDDRTGEPLGPVVPVTIDEAGLDRALERLTGAIAQRPSSVSAIKVDGRRAYRRVLDGEQVDLAARPVVVHTFARRGPLRTADDDSAEFDCTVVCSTGTYVRALARDLGADLGCGGHLTALRRTAVGPFTVSEAVALPSLAEAGGPADGAVRSRVLSLGQAAARVLPAVVLDEDARARAARGQQVACDGPDGISHALLDAAGDLVAVAAPDAGRWRWQAVFAMP